LQAQINDTVGIDATEQDAVANEGTTHHQPGLCPGNSGERKKQKQFFLWLSNPAAIGNLTLVPPSGGSVLIGSLTVCAFFSDPFLPAGTIIPLADPFLCTNSVSAISLFTVRYRSTLGEKYGFYCFLFISKTQIGLLLTFTNSSSILS
jgi:hypothetical protein